MKPVLLSVNSNGQLTWTNYWALIWLSAQILPFHMTPLGSSNSDLPCDTPSLSGPTAPGLHVTGSLYWALQTAA